MWGERHQEYQQVYGNQGYGDQGYGNQGYENQGGYGGQQQQQHEGKFSHELIAGAASFEAMHLFEKRQRAEGQPVSHGFAKEMLAGIAGGEVDKLFETKGLDYLDRERAQRQAQDQAQQMYDNHYGGYQEYNPQQQRPHEVFDQYNRY